MQSELTEQRGDQRRAQRTKQRGAATLSGSQSSGMQRGGERELRGRSAEQAKRADTDRRDQRSGGADWRTATAREGLSAGAQQTAEAERSDELGSDDSARLRFTHKVTAERVGESDSEPIRRGREGTDCTAAGRESRSRAERTQRGAEVRAERRGKERELQLAQQMHTQRGTAGEALRLRGRSG